MEIATFGGGCFWGVEESFRVLKGVKKTVVGYMGGKTKNPSYKDVCNNETGHAEVVQVTFDPKVISFEKLVEVFFSVHDPTQVNRQGPDVGDQYRSVIFYHSSEQKKVAEKVKLLVAKKFKKPIATNIVEAPTFYRAEEYHQQYLMKRGMNVCH